MSGEKDKPAKAGELSALHSQVAKVMVNALNVIEVAQTNYLAASDLLDEDAVADLPQPPEASPALLSVITKFLKDNQITAAPEESTELSELEQRLASKRSRKKVGNVTHLFEDTE
jgi:hypothetical protein